MLLKMAEIKNHLTRQQKTQKRKSMTVTSYFVVYPPPHTGKYSKIGLTKTLNKI